MIEEQAINLLENAREKMEMISNHRKLNPSNPLYSVEDTKDPMSELIKVTEITPELKDPEPIKEKI